MQHSTQEVECKNERKVLLLKLKFHMNVMNSTNSDFHFRTLVQSGRQLLYLPTSSSPDFSYSSSPSCRRSCPARHLPPARNRDTRCSPGALEKITIPFPVETTTTIRVRLFNCESVGDSAFKTCVFFGATCTDDIEIECTEESSRLGAFLCTGS